MVNVNPANTAAARLADRESIRMVRSPYGSLLTDSRCKLARLRPMRLPSRCAPCVSLPHTRQLAGSRRLAREWSVRHQAASGVLTKTHLERRPLRLGTASLD